jgi:hypothetical protein
MTPHGPETRYAVMATVAGAVIEDCRITPAALTDRNILYRGGDGQSVPQPSGGGIVTLPAKLRIAVMRGETPVHNAPVRWELIGPAAAPGQINGASVASLNALTGPDGLSEITWSLNGADLINIHQIRVSITGAPGVVPIVFSARFETAGEHVGCSTYVIAEGSDWVSILAAIKTNESAAVCFQRGIYLTDKQVTFTDKGHLTLHGAGEGTIIRCSEGETALRFERCSSVTVRDLRIETGNSRDTNNGHVMRRNGTLTIFDCPTVTVTDTTLRCGSHFLTERTCLTVQGSEKRAMLSAHIARNALLTGYAQDGMLITDCEHIVIEHNRIFATGRNAKVTDAKLKNSKLWQAQLRRHLVEAPSTAKAAARARKKQVRIGRSIFEFESAIPQEDWDAFMETNPIVAGSVANLRTAHAHMNEIVESIIASPDRMPGFKRVIDGIGVGQPAAVTIQVSRKLLISSEIAMLDRRDQAQVEEGKAIVRVNEIELEFRTPVSRGDWSRLQEHLPIDRIRTQNDLKRELKVLAARLVSDARFRAQFATVEAWFKPNAQPAPNFGRQAITCGGRILGDVVVERNTVHGFVQGVHIGASQGTDGAQATQNAPVIISNARIVANELYLQKPFEAYYAPFGIFLGNMESGRIERNLLMPGKHAGESRHAQGIRVWGHLGQYLMILQNRIGIAALGIRVVAENTIDPDKQGWQYLWLASANLVEGVDPTRVIRAPMFMIRKDRDNRPEPA